MTKKTLLSLCLGLLLSAAFATSAFAVPFWGLSADPLTVTDSGGGSFTYTVVPSFKTTDYASGSLYTSPTNGVGATTSTLVHATFNVNTDGGWSATDTLTVSLFKDGAAVATVIGYGIDSRSGGLSYQHLYYDLYAAYNSASTYYLTAVSNTGATQTWQLTSESLSFASSGVNGYEGKTPIPAAIWILGSGLMGVMGFKRSRKNAA